MWTCGVPQHPRLALQSRDRERPLVSPTLFPRMQPRTVPADLTTPNLTETWVKLHRRMPPLAGDGSNPALHAMIIM